MRPWRQKFQRRESCDLKEKVGAINNVQAVIEFNPDGIILTANENSLHAMGYSLSEVQGQHHRIFCDPMYGGQS